MCARAGARSGVRNRILTRLPSEDFRRLEPHLKLLELEPRFSLYEPNLDLKYVYFPETGVASIMTVLEGGLESEVVTVGFEGMVGLSVFLGVSSVPGRAYWQVSGRAFRLKAEILRQQTRSGGSLSNTLHLYAQALFHQVSLTATCNGRHEIYERCARWLLMTHDRVENDEFVVTHELLSKMLGVRRSGVTVAAGMLQTAGLINYTRGRVRILDREGLEAASCECYRIVRDEFERLLL
jgi:CRP-like cAMP-binding protein